MKRLTYRLKDQHGNPTDSVILEDYMIYQNDATRKTAILNRLAYYEDAEECGRLIILPCKIGDTVYRICKKKYDIDGYGMQWEEDWGIVTATFNLGMFDKIGKTVFLTKEEAEEALRVKYN